MAGDSHGHAAAAAGPPSRLHPYFGRDPYGGFTGWQKHFNTTTNWGRYNIARLTLGTELAIGLYFYLKSKYSKNKKIQK